MQLTTSQEDNRNQRIQTRKLKMTILTNPNNFYANQKTNNNKK